MICFLYHLVWGGSSFTGYTWMVEGVAEDRPGGCCALAAAFLGTEAFRKPLVSPG